MRLKRIVLSIIYIVIIAFICGCSDNKASETKESAEEKQATEAEKQVWDIRHVDLQGYYDTSTIYKDKVYGCFCADNGLHVAVTDIGEQKQREEYVISELEDAIGITISPNENIFILGKKDEQVELWCIDNAGNINREKEIGIEDPFFDAKMKGLYADSQGLYYLWYETDVLCAEVYENAEEDIHTLVDRIYVFDNDMNQICYEQIPNSYGNRLVCFYFDEEGLPGIIAKDENGYYSKKVRKKAEDDFEKVRIKDAKILQNIENSDNISIYDNEVIYIDNEEIHAYSLSENIDRVILPLTSGGIYGNDVSFLNVDKDKYEIINLYRKTGNSEYTEFKKGSTKQTILTLGIAQNDDRMTDAVTDYNHSQNRVRVIIKTYDDYEEEIPSLDEFKMELLTGEGPDLICTDLIDYEILAGHGVFTDLYDFMQGDGNVKKDDLVLQAVRPYEMNGHLYALGPSFSIYTMWGPKSVVGGRQGVDIEELKNILDKSGGGLGNIWGLDTADESVLSTLLTIGLDEYIDWETGTCDFDKEGFCKLIEFAKTFTPADYGNSAYLGKKNRDILLEYGVINSVYDVSLQAKLFGEEIDYIGYPTKDGTGVSVGIYGNVGINAKSEKQEEAWEFLKNYICQCDKSQGFPILKKDFDEKLDASSKEVLLSSNGEEYKQVQESYYEKDVISIDIFKSEQNEIESVRKLVDSISSKYEYHLDIQEMIEEEAELYISGEKSLDEVTKIIQSRVLLYLQERE